MQINVMFAAVPVRQFGESVEWYGRLFGRDADVVPHDTEVMWQLTESSCLYVLEDAPRAGHTVVSIAVDDLDAATAELASRRIHPDVVEDVGDAARKATMTDPDGNRIALIQVA